MKQEKINAFPRKKLFINILTQDVNVKTCILDLIDNSVDSYVRHKTKQRREIKLTLDSNKFEIYDTCGGIDKDFLKKHVFRFGAENLNRDNPTLGMYGIGLKRSIFKMGNSITLETDDGKEYSLMDLNVATWEKDENDWDIPFDTDKSSLKKKDIPYTKVVVKNLHQEVKDKFSLDTFKNDIIDTLSRVYCLIMKDNIDFIFNGRKIIPGQLLVPVDDDYKPSVHIEKAKDIEIQIICFVDPSKGTRLKNAVNERGWNLFCNNRLILANDTSTATGWIGGEKKDKSILPKYHPIYNEFRGIVFLNSNNPFNLPLNTSKSGLNIEDKNYHYILNKMIKTARPIIDYLNDKYNKEKEEEEEIEERIEQNIDKDYKPKKIVSATDITKVSQFEAPDKKGGTSKSSAVRISYSKEKKIVEKVKNYMEVDNYKDVGEKTFEYYVKMEGLDE